MLMALSGLLYMFSTVIASMLLVIISTLGGADPKFQGTNVTHQAIAAADIKAENFGSFSITPVGEHSVVFAFDHKKFAKITADEKHFVLVINPADVPEKYKQVKRIEGNFESNIQDANDLQFVD